MTIDNLYAEPPGAANPFRTRMLREVNALVRRKQRDADRCRRHFFQPDLTSIPGYEVSVAEYRKELVKILGWPLTEADQDDIPSVSVKPVGEDALGCISRVWIAALPHVRTYGLFFRPHGKGRFPLVISQHGGLGTPELCSGFFGSANYNDMTRRVLRRGVAVFAPQLLLWDPNTFGPKYDKDNVDRDLKQIGGSLAALELYRISRSLTYFTRRKDIDPARIGMIGLSYGGFYTLFAAALDPRIRVALSSCFFNDRRTYGWPDWSWFNSANRLLDAEVGALVCPRPLYIEVGRKDDLFDVRRARPEARKLATFYHTLGLAERFRYKEHAGGHELDRADDGIDFLCRHLEVR